MIEGIKKILWIGVLGLFLLPLIQQFYPVKHIPKLNGAFVPAKEPEHTLDAWFNTEFQQQSQNYLKEQFGFRPFFVRLNNQLEYDLGYKINSSEIYLGKDDYLFRFYNELYKKHTLFRGEAAIKEKIDKLEALSTYLYANFQTKIITIIPPGKHYFHEEFLPDLNKGPDSLNNNYKEITKKLEERNLAFIDFNKHFSAIKDAMDYPLYAKSGIHWTMLGAFHAMDSVIRYMEQVEQVDLANIHLTETQNSDNWIPDQDIYYTLNLIREWDDLDLQYADLIPDSTGKKPRVTTIGDSYYHAVTWPSIPDIYFGSKSVFWYYNRAYFNTKNEVLNDKNFKENIENSDYILLMFTPINLENFGAGFIEEAYDTYLLKDSLEQ